jgi:hypothetical protein
VGNDIFFTIHYREVLPLLPSAGRYKGQKLLLWVRPATVTLAFLAITFTSVISGICSDCHLAYIAFLPSLAPVMGSNF